jgi:hypothetical protein
MVFADGLLNYFPRSLVVRASLGISTHVAIYVCQAVEVNGNVRVF